MGEVYKAQDMLLDRIVALKFLSAELAHDRQSLARFRKEAMAASALNHPNICTVYDFGEDHDRAFIIMEFLEGNTLAERLRRGPCTVAEATKIGFEVSSALSAAHRKGIVHRDLKPGNIMLAATGAKLLDFGLAQKTISADQVQG
jgi:eukaryotic-like serine/threonine-protein kinase